MGLVDENLLKIFLDREEEHGMAFATRLREAASTSPDTQTSDKDMSVFALNRSHGCLSCRAEAGWRLKGAYW
jgi:hypothetical protein